MNKRTLLTYVIPAATLLGMAPAKAVAQDAQAADTTTTLMRTVSIDGVKKQISYRPDRQKIDAGGVLSAQGGTALDILKAVPGVMTDSEGNLTYRGSENFQVYIDGTLSPLTGSDALRMISSASISGIELLTTPGARYRSEGDAGIIHIITKTATQEGWDLNLNGTGSTWGSYGLDGKLSYRHGHHLVWAGGQGTNLKQRSLFRQEKITEAGADRVHSYADGTRFRRAETYTGSGGYEYSSLWHHLDVSLLGGRTRNPRGGDMSYSEQRYSGGALVSDATYDSHDRYGLTKYLFQTAANYVWKTHARGDQLTLSSRFRYDRYSQEYTESNLFDTRGDRYEGTRGYETEHHWDCDASAAYRLQYRRSGRLEAGWQYTTYSEHGDYKIRYWDRGEKQFQWQDDLYAPFYYRRQMHAGYAQLTDRMGPVSIDAGLRVEHYTDDMDLPTITSRHRKYTDLFPSAHLNYYTASAGTFGLGYSRRSNRPGIWKLEPYITYEDYYTRIIGNPDLRAEFIHSAELSWRKSDVGRADLAATAYARRRTDVVDYARRAYAPGVTLDSIINAGNEWDFGLDAQVSVRAITRQAFKWQTTVNAGGYYYDFTPTATSSAQYVGCASRDGLTWQASWLNALSFPRCGLNVQFDAHGVGPRVLPQGRERAYVYFDLSARKRFLSDKLSVGLVAHDIFHTAKYYNSRHSAYLTSRTWVRPRYPNISVSASYYFRQTGKHTAGKMDALEFVGKDF